MLIAITRAVGPAIARCELTHLERRPIDAALASAQHRDYAARLAALGCTVRTLPAEPELPDSVFVEDTAVVLPELAVATRPGAAVRRPEVDSVAEALRPYRTLREIVEPGTLDGGDVLRMGKRVYVGQGGRSNPDGLAQLRELLAPYGYSVEGVRLRGCLHLKTAVSRVGERTLLINPRWVDPGAFGEVELISVDPAEPFAANALAVGDALIHSAEFVRTRDRLEASGLRVEPVEFSELGKAEAGVTCCSVVFEA